jgi:hypothetical protein
MESTMRVSHWLRPLAAHLTRTCRQQALHRLRFRPRVEALEDRTVPSTVAWNGLGGDNNWDTGSGHIGQRNQRRRVGPQQVEEDGLRAEVERSEAG